MSDQNYQIKDRHQMESEYANGRKWAMFAGAAVYAGVVLVGTVLFISFVLTAFPSNAYFTRFIMTVGGVLVAGSLLSFPFALHNWATRGKHRSWAVALYFGEMVFFAANTIVSFSVLLSQQNGYAIPEWMQLYEPFTILSIVYVIVAWGVMFWLGPEGQKKAKMIDAWASFDDEVVKMIEKYPSSREGLAAIERHAQARVDKAFALDDDSPKPFAGRAYAADVDGLPNSKSQ